MGMRCAIHLLSEFLFIAFGHNSNQAEVQRGSYSQHSSASRETPASDHVCGVLEQGSGESCAFR